MRWPSFADYEFAVMNAFAYSVLDPKFKGGSPGKGISGGFSRVYPVDVGAKTFALRCWTRNVADAKMRYEEISACLKRIRLPYFVDFAYVSEGILVDRQKYSTTRMEWAEGQTLRAFIADNLQNPDVFKTVAAEFQKMVETLHAHQISHGDLQDGNILLKRNGARVEIKLIDYDSLFVPALRGQPDSIVGLPEYQHPQRIAGGGQASEKVDYFSELVIYLSFLSLAEKPELWAQFQENTGDGLLFSAEDFKSPSQSAIFRELENLSPEVKHLADTLRHFCGQTSIEQLAPLEEVLPKKANAAEAKDYYTQGLTCLHNNRYNEAVGKFGETINLLYKDLKEAYYGLGLTYFKMGKLREAKAASEKALSFDANYELARQLLELIAEAERNRWHSTASVGRYCNLPLSSPNPGCFVILVDQSESMNGQLETGTKAEVAPFIVSDLIYKIGLACDTAQEIRGRCHVSVISYGEQVECLIDGMISDVFHSPIATRKVTKSLSDGVGGVVEIEMDVPLWVHPKASGNAQMHTAFERAAEIVQQWCIQSPNGFPPVVVNITGGVLTSPELTREAVRKVMNFHTTDGNVLVFNNHIANGGTEVVFPHDTTQFRGDSSADFLFRSSSVLPPPLFPIFQSFYGFSPQRGARGFAYNSTETMVFGTLFDSHLAKTIRHYRKDTPHVWNPI